MRGPALGGAAVLVLAWGAPLESHALWEIHEIVNESGEILTLSTPVGPGRHPVKDLMNRGQSALVIPGHGVVYFEDRGDNPNCSDPGWRVRITFKNETWGLFYNGLGLVNVTIDSGGCPSFSAASDDSEVTLGDAPPPCATRRGRRA